MVLHVGLDFLDPATQVPDGRRLVVFPVHRHRRRSTGGGREAVSTPEQLHAWLNRRSTCRVPKRTVRRRRKL
jgi:hypothetical protein